MGDLLVLGDGDRQPTVADGRRAQLDLAADDDGPGARIHDDLGGLARRVHFQVLDGGEVGDPLGRIPRCEYLDGGGVHRLGGVRTHQIVDHVRQTAGGGEVRPVQVEGDGVALAEGVGNLPLHGRPVGDAPHCGRVHHHLGAVRPFGPEATDHQAALGHRIDAAIQPFQEGLEQGAATQALRLADGGDGDVYGLTRLGEGGQIRVDGHRRHVLDLGLDVVRHLDAEVVEHGPEGLLGEGVVLLPRAGQAHHQTVTDQLVAAHSFHRGEVLDAGCVRQPEGQQAAQQGKQTESVHDIS